MRRFGYLAVVLGLFAISLGVYFYWPPNTRVPDGEAFGEPAPPLAAATRAHPHKETITVEGENLSPWEKQALAEAFRKIISDAIHEVVNRGIEKLFRELRITDELEVKLLAAADCRPGPNAGPEPDPDSPLVWSIHLIRSGPADQPPEAIEVTEDRPVTIRFTRAYAAVERPVAVATLTWVRAGRLQQRERFLVYGADGEWRSAERGAASDRGHDK